MKKISFAGLLIITGLIAGCNGNDQEFDAQGTFETDEVIVSSELTGKILSFNVREGDPIGGGSVVGVIDAENLSLQKEQMEASIAALQQKTSDVTPQVRLLQDQLAVQQSKLQTLERERTRTENLVKQDAATPKQLDDINASIDVAKREMAVTQQQIAVQRSNVATQNRSILSEKAPLEKRVAQLSDQLDQANIVNPIKGTVITKYAEAGEMTSVGKALYKIANLDTLVLRAYISGVQLSQVKLNQPVKVMVDSGAKKYRSYPGTITWVSDKAEFTPIDYHPNAVPAPYNHSNIDSDELLYYVDGDFMSRKNVTRGMLTLHPGGIPHGPHPGAVEKSIGAKETKELAVMVDTFHPLQLTVEALAIENPNYTMSWAE